MARNRRNKRSNRGKNNLSKEEEIIQKNYKSIVIGTIVIIACCVGIILVKNYEQSLKVAEQRRMLEEKIESIFEDIDMAQENDEENTEQQQEDITVNIAVVGDILCGNAMIEDAKKADGSYDFSHMFSQITSYIKDSDIAIGTFETNIISTQGYSGTGKCNSPVEFARAVKNSGINLVSISHNHALDYGLEGLNTTKSQLETLGYTTVGAKTNLEDKNYVIKNVKGIQIAFLAYTYGFSNEEELTQEDKQHINTYSDELAKSDLENALQEADCAVVIMHWGDVNSTSRSQQQEEIAQYLVDNGASIIVGAHPAVIEPMQIKQNAEGDNAFVSYSVGNYTSIGLK